jgi:hypothetical protein
MAIYCTSMVEHGLILSNDLLSPDMMSQILGMIIHMFCTILITSTQLWSLMSSLTMHNILCNVWTNRSNIAYKGSLYSVMAMLDRIRPNFAQDDRF